MHFCATNLKTKTNADGETRTRMRSQPQLRNDKCIMTKITVEGQHVLLLLPCSSFYQNTVETELNLLPVAPFLVYMSGTHLTLENLLSENNITS